MWDIRSGADFNHMENDDIQYGRHEDQPENRFFNSFLGSLIRNTSKFCVERPIVCRFKFDLLRSHSTHGGHLENILFNSFPE